MRSFSYGGAEQLHIAPVSCREGALYKKAHAQQRQFLISTFSNEILNSYHFKGKILLTAVGRARLRLSARAMADWNTLCMRRSLDRENAREIV